MCRFFSIYCLWPVPGSLSLFLDLLWCDQLFSNTGSWHMFLIIRDQAFMSFPLAHFFLLNQSYRKVIRSNVDIPIQNYFKLLPKSIHLIFFSKKLPKGSANTSCHSSPHKNFSKIQSINVFIWLLDLLVICFLWTLFCWSLTQPNINLCSQNKPPMFTLLTNLHMTKL